MCGCGGSTTVDGCDVGIVGAHAGYGAGVRIAVGFDVVVGVNGNVVGSVGDVADDAVIIVDSVIIVGGCDVGVVLY